MKENVLDVLVFLFDNYWDDELTPEVTETNIACELEQAGFDVSEIDKAFTWLEELVGLQSQEVGNSFAHPASVRVFTQEEAQRLDVAAQGLLIRLEQQGLLDSVTREIIIDRASAIDGQIGLLEMKQIIGLVVLNQASENEDLGWAEDLYYEAETPKVTH